MANDEQTAKEQIVLELMRQLAQHDDKLRKKYKIGHKFRFIKDRLAQLIEQLEVSQVDTSQKKAELDYVAQSDETLVYVHLFNVQGLKLASWQNMLNPKLLYEYSINRPIYIEKNAIESLIRNKENKFQHAYITVAVKNQDIISGSETKDAAGNTLIRIKEGSLEFEKFILFTHNDHHYRVDEKGVISKKEI